MGYRVIGIFRQPHKDCEAETQDCKTYAEALILQSEWKKERKYKKREEWIQIQHSILSRL